MRPQLNLSSGRQQAQLLPFSMAQNDASAKMQVRPQLYRRSIIGVSEWPGETPEKARFQRPVRVLSAGGGTACGSSSTR